MTNSLPSSPQEDTEQDWEVSFDSKFKYLNTSYATPEGLVMYESKEEIKSFIRNLLSKSSLRGERNRLISQIREEVKQELREAISKIPSDIVDTRANPYDEPSYVDTVRLNDVLELLK